MTTPRNLLIGGTWLPSGDGSTFSVEDPATGIDIAQVADASVDDGVAALDAAAKAQTGWAATSPRFRAELLRAAWSAVLDHTDELAALITAEMGKPRAEARDEVLYGAEYLRWFSEEAARIRGTYGTSPEGSTRLRTHRRPVGPCLLVTPWNFPLAMATRKIAPAVAAGCAMVLKPSELTPLTALRFAEILSAAGLPDGVLNVVPTTRADQLCRALLADRRLRKLSFTGSTTVGRHLLRHSADGVLRTSMELGGNAAFLVFEDANIEQAVEGALLAKLRNMGQACTAANRFLVAESVAEEFTSILSQRFSELRVGSGDDPATDVGPLIDARATARMEFLLADAVNRGARVTTGGNTVPGPGYFLRPTVVTDVPEHAEIVGTEIFGPVAAITSFTSERHAVELANATPYGLAAYLFSSDVDRVMRLSEQLETGMIGVNTGVVSNPAAPFGGVKQSGLGREGGADGIDEYLEVVYTAFADPWRSAS